MCTNTLYNVYIYSCNFLNAFFKSTKETEMTLFSLKFSDKQNDKKVSIFPESNSNGPCFLKYFTLIEVTFVDIKCQFFMPIYFITKK